MFYKSGKAITGGRKTTKSAQNAPVWITRITPAAGMRGGVTRIVLYVVVGC